MIRERGLFTLFGTKPMTEFDVEIGLSETLEERQKEYLSLIQTRKESNGNPSFVDFINEWEESPHLNHKGQWLHWAKHQNRLVGSRYLFITRKTPHGDGLMGLFINVPEAIYLLDKYYPSFSRITGMAFQPETILDELSDNNSPFWTSVFQNHFLFGLLMGYGEKNAFIYDLFHKKNPDNNPVFLHLNEIHPDADKNLFFSKKIRVTDLALPNFGSYSIYDETLEKYLREKEKILVFMRKKNFVTTILENLKLTMTSD